MATITSFNAQTLAKTSDNSPKITFNSKSGEITLSGSLVEAMGLSAGDKISFKFYEDEEDEQLEEWYILKDENGWELKSRATETKKTSSLVLRHKSLINELFKIWGEREQSVKVMVNSDPVNLEMEEYPDGIDCYLLNIENF